jgi:2-polyprenyl-6-methoxyphenol hydroxylase-like FAD-dependent oxidoreductase
MLWHSSGPLVIGDAAHTMSPIGGVGINYAVQDAVVATNLLAGLLRLGRVEVQDLAKGQKEREWPVKGIQSVQATMQDRVLAGALRSQTVPSVPWYVRAFFATPVLRNIPARVFAFGLRHVRLKAA